MRGMVAASLATSSASCSGPEGAAPVLRERVAAFAIEAGNLDVALSQVEALMLLEPNQPRHQKRMEAIRLLQERSGG